jgi:hypothetical protein
MMRPISLGRRPCFGTFNGGFGGGGSAAAPTDLSASRAAAAVTLQSSTGADAVIPEADSVSAGVMSAADKVKLAGLAGTPAYADTAAVSAATPAGDFLRTAGYPTRLATAVPGSARAPPRSPPMRSSSRPPTSPGGRWCPSTAPSTSAGPGPWATA